MGNLILLVEDNKQILHGNKQMLKLSGYDVITALTLSKAREQMNKNEPDAIVLDIMLPDGSGLDFMRELRKDSDIPILLLTGLTAPEDIVRGLKEGSDDYLTKPYDFDVLLARIEALLRRSERIPKTLIKGALKLEIIANRALLDGEDIFLTKKEFALLLTLVKNERRALSAQHLYKTVWRQSMGKDDSAVKTAVSNLRRKLGNKFTIQYDADEGGYIFESIPE